MKLLSNLAIVILLAIAIATPITFALQDHDTEDVHFDMHPFHLNSTSLDLKVSNLPFHEGDGNSYRYFITITGLDPAVKYRLTAYSDHDGEGGLNGHAVSSTGLFVVHPDYSTALADFELIWDDDDLTGLRGFHIHMDVNDLSLLADSIYVIVAIQNKKTKVSNRYTSPLFRRALTFSKEFRFAYQANAPDSPELGNLPFNATFVEPISFDSTTSKKLEISTVPIVNDVRPPYRWIMNPYVGPQEIVSNQLCELHYTKAGTPVVVKVPSQIEHGVLFLLLSNVVDGFSYDATKDGKEVVVKCPALIIVELNSKKHAEDEIDHGFETHAVLYPAADVIPQDLYVSTPYDRDHKTVKRSRLSFGKVVLALSIICFITILVVLVLRHFNLLCFKGINARNSSTQSSKPGSINDDNGLTNTSAGEFTTLDNDNSYA